MSISVIVPAYNAMADLPNLLDSLLYQNHKDFEVIVVDDCSEDSTVKIVESYDYPLIQLTKNHGPAYCRNIGAKKARGEILVFTDSDCTVEPSWLEHIQNHFCKDEAEAAMGRLVLLPSTYLGNSISALGFPAGGALGFDKIWKVDSEGLTNSLSSCNCAIRKNIFWQVGGFDESFPFPGGEDTLLAYNLKKRAYRIKYCSDIVVYHKPRESLRDFVKWQFRRGISSYIFSKKVHNRVSFGTLRIWSTMNIIRHYWADKKFPLILFLLATSFSVQLFGFLLAKYKRKFNESSNH